MDSVDVKIFRALMMGGGSFFGNDVRRSYRSISARLGVTEDTVRNRVEKFRSDGMIRAWRVGVNPGVFGRQASYFFFDVRPPSSKEDVIRKVKLVDGVLFILSYFGDHLGVHITYESEKALRRKRELISRMSNSDEVISVRVSYPNPAVRLTQTDWNLIGSLKKNPRRSFSEIGKALRISSRTAKRRIERLISTGVIYTLPDIDVKAISGVVVASLSVYYSDPALAQKTAGAIVSRFEDYLLLFHAGDSEHSWLGFALPNVAKANEIERWVKDMDGVRGTSLRLVEGFVNLVEEALDGDLRKRAVFVESTVRLART